MSSSWTTPDSRAAVFEARLIVMVEKNVEILQSVEKLLERLQASTEKTSRALNQISEQQGQVLALARMAENRQQQARARGTEACIQGDVYMRGSSPNVGPEVVSTLVQSVVEFGKRGLEYSTIFERKEVSRSEALVAFFYETFVEGHISSFRYPEFKDIGVLGKYIPSFRATLRREFEHQKARGMWSGVEVEDFEAYLGPVPIDVEILQRLCLPISSSYEIIDKRFEAQPAPQASSPTPPSRAQPVSAVEVLKATEDTGNRDLHEMTDVQLFSSLSKEIKAFVEHSPTCTTQEPRKRVSECVIHWMLYLEEIAYRQKRVQQHETLERSQLLEQGRDLRREPAHDLLDWVPFHLPTVGHREILGKYDRVGLKRKRDVEDSQPERGTKAPKHESEPPTIDLLDETQDSGMRD